MEAIKWTLRAAKGQMWKIILGVIISGINICLMFIPPIIYKDVIDDVFYAGKVELLVPLLSVVLVIIGVRAILVYVSNTVIENGAQHAVKNLRMQLYDKLQSFDNSYYGQNRTGDLMMKLTGDLDWVRHFLSWVISNVITNVALFIITLIIFAMENIWLTVIALVLTPITTIITLRLRKAIRPMHDKVRAEVAQLNTVVQENISGNRVVKAVVREDFEAERFQERNIAYREANINTVKTWWRFGPFIDGFANILTVMLLLMGGIFVINGNLTIGGLNMFLSLAWALNDPLRMMGIIVNDHQRFMASVEKIMTIYYYKPDIKSPEKAYAPKAPRGDIEIKNASFKYNSQKILTDINFVAKSGETIGIMGPTGSGKTTLTSLISRFIDASSGEVLIDGVNVKNYDINALRSMIGMAMQDVFLFSDTIDSNIAYGKPESDEEHVKDCATDADADSFIKRMPQGYDTIIGERGVGLSGGQRQRVALARALAYDTPILILDDTTSAVDMETEHYIQGRLRERKRKATTIIIAQRISSVKDADRIYIIEDGRITESGTHKELLANRGYYYNIYQLQQGNFSDGGDK